MSSNRIRRKQRVAELLRQPDFAVCRAGLRQFDPQELLNPLFSCLCHPDEVVRWRAVSAFGTTVSAIAGTDAEQARVIMRRFLWMLNDESGGIGWGVPEAMGEVMAASSLLAGEYLHMLVSYTLDDGPALFEHGNFLEHPALQEGVLWGLCRTVGGYRKHLLDLGVDSNLRVYFSADQSGVRAQVCRLCGLLCLSRYRDEVAELRADESVVSIYEEGVFVDTKIADLAKQAHRLMG